MQSRTEKHSKSRRNEGGNGDASLALLRIHPILSARLYVPSLLDRSDAAELKFKVLLLDKLILSIYKLI
jgi:hypothetical protein